MDKKVYEYRAIAKGAIERPFRFFVEDDIITSYVPIEHPALVDASLPKPRPTSDVIVPYMTINGRKQRPDYEVNNVIPQHATELANKGVPTITDEHYDRGMEGVKRMEAIFDGKEKAATPAVNPEADFNTGGVSGTGNQDVI